MGNTSDGIYRLLLMNDNQLPILGHLLCKPLLSSALISAAVGPTNVLSRGQQELYRVERGIHVLG